MFLFFLSLLSKESIPFSPECKCLVNSVAGVKGSQLPARLLVSVRQKKKIQIGVLNHRQKKKKKNSLHCWYTIFSEHYFLSAQESFGRFALGRRSGRHGERKKGKRDRFSVVCRVNPESMSVLRGGRNNGESAHVNKDVCSRIPVDPVIITYLLGLLNVCEIKSIIVMIAHTEHNFVFSLQVLKHFSGGTLTLFEYFRPSLSLNIEGR